ncbi:MAG: HAD family phosphatase [Acidobacteria bacterium]|nr:HAD family phosphatase [Acidobacteriota bacterium]
MSEIDILFFDVGGVCLTNGWDADARRAASRHFSLDFEDVEARHHTLAEAFERGDCGLEAYLAEVVFHRARPFTREAVIAFMQAQSRPHPSSLSLIRRLASENLYRLAAINNESRELNRYRIDAFGLGTIFSAFFSSCYLGVLKPDPRIYQLALEVMHAAPSRCLFIDDREENVAGAQAVGMRAIHVSGPGRLAAALRAAGTTLGP